jgi:hypothetical protein
MSERPDSFLSIGQAVRSRIPVDAQGNFPINRTLIAVLAFGVAVFNQGLFWLLAVLMAGRGQTVGAGRFVLASLGLGAVLWLVLVAVQARVTGGGSRRDWLVVCLTAVLLSFGWVATSPGCVVAAVGGLTLWSARGFKKQEGG